MCTYLSALPALCITNNRLPEFKPYLTIPKELAHQWHTKINSKAGHINVGIYWKSSETCCNKAEDKTLPFNIFNELMQQLSIRCYALQQPSQEEYNQLYSHNMITVLNKNMCPEKEIVQLCSLMSALDMIITCDSLIAHLAGALGKPVILIIPEITQWRWIAQEHQSLFYPSMHIIQLKKNNYSDMITQLTEYIGKYSSTFNYGIIK